MKRAIAAPARGMLLGLLAVLGAAPAAGGCQRAPAEAPGAASSAPRAKGMHSVVFEATGEGPDQWTGVLNNVENVRQALGPEATRITVVAHGGGLGMLLLAASEGTKDRLRQLAAAGVVFAACENTMRKQNVTRADLISVATTVDSGVAEVVRKQEAGWAYIKVGG